VVGSVLREAFKLASMIADEKAKMTVQDGKMQHDMA
jgi:hypothetical protein